MLRALVLISLVLSPSCFASAPAAAGAKEGMNGWEAFSSLQNGNMRFYEGKSQHPHSDVPRREELASGQKPHTIILSCSDSRTSPELIFDQGLGDVFPIRVAGNVVSPDALASIEYAVEHIGSRLLLVLGHESCGAVNAAVGSKAGVSSGSEHIDQLVTHIRGHLSAGAIASATTDKTIRLPVKENVVRTMRELLKRSEIVREAVRKKGLVLAQGIYSLKTGRVEFWDVGSKFDLDASGAVAAAPTSAHSAEPMGIVEQRVTEEVITDVPAQPKKKAKAATH